MGYCNNSGYNTNKTGWWYTYPSEKSWSSSVEIIISNIWKNIWKYIVTGKDDIPYMKCKKKAGCHSMVPNHQAVMADRHVDNVNVYRLNPVDMVEPGKWIG